MPATRPLETAAGPSSADAVLLNWDSEGRDRAGKVEPWEDPGLGVRPPGFPGTANGACVPLGSCPAQGLKTVSPGSGGLGVKSGSAPVSPSCLWGNGHPLGSSLGFKLAVCGHFESFGAWRTFRR